MNRRDFVKFLALVGAGAAALPEQIAAFERYYEVNTPLVDSGLVSVGEVFLAGMAQKSLPMMFNVTYLGEVKLALGINAFGGLCRWIAMPDQKIVLPAREFVWDIRGLDDGHSDITMSPFPLTGHISYIDQTAVRYTRVITKTHGNLGEPPGRPQALPTG